MDRNPWFRLYSRIMTDPKVEYLAFEDQRHFIWLLCMKNEGYLDERFPTTAIRHQMISRKLGIHGEALENAKARLLEVGLIDDNWNPISWDELQFRSDSSKERTRKYRERKKKKDQERHGDVTVTAQETEKEKEADTETEQEHSHTRARVSSFICGEGVDLDMQALRNMSLDPGVDVDFEIEKFRHHEFNRPITDWQSAAHKWLLNARPRISPYGLTQDETYAELTS